MAMPEPRKRLDDTKQVIQSIGRGALSTVVLQGKILKTIYKHTLGAIWHHFWIATLLGKLFILWGFGAAIAIGYFACQDAIVASFSQQEVVAIKVPSAKIHEGTSSTSLVVASVQKGDNLTLIGEAEEWWFVEGKNWKKPGWIPKSQSTLEKKALLTVEYEMRGYGIAFACSLLMMYIGFCLKRTSVA
jgi:hypothetical protein